MGKVIIPEGLQRKEIWLHNAAIDILKEQAKTEGLTLKAYIQQLCSKHADKLIRDKAKLTSV